MRTKPASPSCALREDPDAQATAFEGASDEVRALVSPGYLHPVVRDTLYRSWCEDQGTAGGDCEEPTCATGWVLATEHSTACVACYSTVETTRTQVQRKLNWAAYALTQPGFAIDVGTGPVDGPTLVLLRGLRDEFEGTGRTPAWLAKIPKAVRDLFVAWADRPACPWVGVPVLEERATMRRAPIADEAPPAASAEEGGDADVEE